jgi:hypothetical protein
MLVGFSNYFNQVTKLSERSFKIFAGSTGKPCSGNGELPCNSCNDSTAITSLNPTTQGLVCNDRQIYPNLLFTVTMVSTAPEAYPVGCTNLLIALEGTNLITPFQVTSYAPSTKNQNVTASWTWSSLCDALSGDSTCQKSFIKSIRVGFNSSCGNTTLLDGAVDFNIAFRFVKTSPFMSFGCPNNMGSFEAFCDYTVFPGDKKLYILNSAANVANNLDAGDQSNAMAPTIATSRDPSGIKYSAVRAYYEAGSFADIKLNSNFIDIPISLSGGISDRRISGLENGVAYSVIIANKDEAGNVELFAHPNNPANDTGLPMSDLTNDIGNTQAAIPQPVVGLLEDQRCFIATAAFGNPNDKQVVTLRRFRDQVLLNTKWGEKFVNWYYSWSPAVAKWVSSHNWLRAITRGILWPFVWFIDLAQAQEIPDQIVEESAESANDELDSTLEAQISSEIEKETSLDDFVDPPLDSAIDKREDGKTDTNNEQNATEYFEEDHDLNQVAEPTETKKLWPNPEAFIESSKEIRSGKKKIQHPLEDRGLLKINVDGSYDYAVYGEARKKTLSFTAYNLPSLKITGPFGSYLDFYGKTVPVIVSGGQEWLIFPEISHNLSLCLSGGLGSVIGNGVLVNAGVPSEERYSLYTIPLSADFVYRLDYIKNQWVAPFLIGGAGYLGLVELRDDSNSIRFAGAPFVETGAGLLVSLMRIDPKAMFILKRDYELTDIWLNFQAKAIKSLKSDIDFEDLVVGAGLVLDF